MRVDDVAGNSEGSKCVSMSWRARRYLAGRTSFKASLAKVRPATSSHFTSGFSVMIALPTCTGLHSSTLRLNVSAFCGTGCTSRGCLGGVWELSGGLRAYYGVFRVCFVSETAQVELKSGRV